MTCPHLSWLVEQHVQLSKSKLVETRITKKIRVEASESSLFASTRWVAEHETHVSTNDAQDDSAEIVILVCEHCGHKHQAAVRTLQAMIDDPRLVQAVLSGRPLLTNDGADALRKAMSEAVNGKPLPPECAPSNHEFDVSGLNSVIISSSSTTGAEVTVQCPLLVCKKCRRCRTIAQEMPRLVQSNALLRGTAEGQLLLESMSSIRRITNK